MKQSTCGKNFIWVQAEFLVREGRKSDFQIREKPQDFKWMGFFGFRNATDESEWMKVFYVPTTTMGQVAQFEQNQLPGKVSK